MTILTRVGSAKKGTKSLKTTIPEGITEFMELTDRDEIEWKMYFQENKRMAIVQKKQNVDSINQAHYALKRKKRLQ